MTKRQENSRRQAVDHSKRRNGTHRAKRVIQRKQSEKRREERLQGGREAEDKRENDLSHVTVASSPKLTTKVG